MGDRKGEAFTLNNIGYIYHSLGEPEKALDYYNQFLLLAKAINDRAGEAGAFNNIGGVYDNLGEKEKALDHYNQSLPLSRAVGDRRGEAATLNNIGLVYDALGEKEKALDYYNQSLPLSQAIDRSCWGSRYPCYIAVLEASRGNLQAALIPMQASIDKTCFENVSER